MKKIMLVTILLIAIMLSACGSNDIVAETVSSGEAVSESINLTPANNTPKKPIKQVQDSYVLQELESEVTADVVSEKTDITANNISNGIEVADETLFERTECLDEVIVLKNSNIRTAPNTSAELVATVPKGTILSRVAVISNGWSEVQYGEATCCYISSKLIDKYSAENLQVAPETIQDVTQEKKENTPENSAVGKTKTEGDTTFVCQGYTPGGLEIWCASWDVEGSWPDYLIAVYDACGITNEMSDYDKAVAINNYICRTVGYAYDTTGCDERIAYCACLTVGKADCMGYTHAFETLCTMAGVYAGSARGTVANAAHVWNYVSISGVRYWVDVTGNDSCNNAYLMSTTQFPDHECSSID